MLARSLVSGSVINSGRAPNGHSKARYITGCLFRNLWPCAGSMIDPLQAVRPACSPLDVCSDEVCPPEQMHLHVRRVGEAGDIDAAKPVKEGLQSAHVSALLAAADAQPGDLLLLAAGPEATVYKCVDNRLWSLHLNALWRLRQTRTRSLTTCC